MGENVWEPRTGLIDETTIDDQIAEKPELCVMTNLGDVTCTTEKPVEAKWNKANFNPVRLIIGEDGEKSNNHGDVNINFQHVGLCHDTKSSTISFKNVNYEVDVQSPRSCCRRKEKQYIVKDARLVYFLFNLISLPLPAFPWVLDGASIVGSLRVLCENVSQIWVETVAFLVVH